MCFRFNNINHSKTFIELLTFVNAQNFQISQLNWNVFFYSETLVKPSCWNSKIFWILYSCRSICLAITVTKIIRFTWNLAQMFMHLAKIAVYFDVKSLKKNTPINSNTNCHREMKLISINMDYCPLQFDVIEFFSGVRLHGECLYLTLIFPK